MTHCECEACPFNICSEQSQYANNAGCLPDYIDTVAIFEQEGLVWACHDNPKKACSGIINYYKKNKDVKSYNLFLKAIQDNKLKYDWSVHGKEYDYHNFILSYLKEGSIVSTHLFSIIKVHAINKDNSTFSGLAYLGCDNSFITVQNIPLSSISNLFLRDWINYNHYEKIFKQHLSS